ncbi:hypothetical protein TraAM80_04796 [Trypanosoma rangeli]|uniref:CRAL-TRIO domain-containing protein n=1 Tax=Trypanosoma rangeli TaxID=5698 RepID=A0A3R7MM64_TRYRA|nr:uncharacterized protein TraAM80_04796 [Trypanosoma rangeli]RNF05027.1 hypothetical protein TraAM80_04796 [Trypanosoma rangeli]|eukprot:RNF05027.1 hypothetical protein TraAM80_04796 [Trypanosoma rangeli]
MSSCVATEGRRLYDPNTEGVGCTREQQVLLELKTLLGWTPSVTLDASVDAFILRYLSAVHFSVSEAAALLKQRRSYEVSLPSLHITAPVVDVLRSGAVSVIGRDVLGRPVLYVTTHHISQSVLETEDLQRLVTVLMEYMLSYCAQAPASPPNGNGGGSTLPQEHQQEIILLVNEEVSLWHASQAALANLNAICSVVCKYYPRFVRLVLLFQPSLDVRHGIKAAFGKKLEESMRVVQVVTRGNIQKYIDRSVLTLELGGSNTSVASPDTFTDAVLSHWFNVRSYLTIEDTKTRPLWQLPPSFVNIGDWSLLQRRAVATTAASPVILSARGNQCERISCTSRPSTAFLGASEEDEGFCSAISEGEDLAHINGNLWVTPRDVSVDIDAVNNTSSSVLVQELQKERDLRIAAEQQLKKIRLGITLDLAIATEVERTLTCIHSELNVLVGNVVVRAKDAAANGSPPTLVQLLDLTLSALELAAHKVQRVPAMKFAVSVSQTTPPSTSCCCMM